MVGADCENASYCSLCGYEAGIALGHSWIDATCAAPKTCSTCSLTEGKALEHSWVGTDCLNTPFCTGCGTYGDFVQHSWIEADCENPKFCNACRITEGDPLGHNWVQTSCKEPLACSNCSLTTTEGIEHSWVFTNCTTQRYCGDCQLVEADAPGHQWKDATCKNPPICSVCKLASGKALGHSWVDANCENPKTCIRCALTEGKALGHDYKLTERLPSTCSGGRDVYVCHCGSENIVTYPSLIDYHICDVTGLCSGCNIQFDPSKMSIISIVVGESYTVNCGVFSSTECPNNIYKPITAQDIGMPIVDINGDLSKASKTVPTTLSFSYDDGGETKFNCFAEMRIQGASSANYAKKNYSIKLVNSFGDNNKVKLVDGWGREHKYCMKANWVDYSQARNVVSGQIYGDVVRTQGEESVLYSLPSGGAIDGFPIIVFNNGVFHGLYTMNVPKDKWMFDMSDSDEKKQAIVMAEHWDDCVAMRVPISYHPNSVTWRGSSNWELEFASNEDSLVDNSTLWVAESLNRLIEFTINNDGQAFKDGISQYCDVDKCIDSILYTFFICADDNISKNVLWVTYDGTHWFSSMYDMDGTWGLQWNGNLSFIDGNTHPISNLATSTNTRYNLLWQKLYINFYDRFVERYWKLRQDGGPLSMENITARFTAFFNKIPDIVRDAERAKWTGVPSQTTNNLGQILAFAQVRMEKMDAILKP